MHKQQTHIEERETSVSNKVTVWQKKKKERKILAVVTDEASQFINFY